MIKHWTPDNFHCFSSDNVDAFDVINDRDPNSNPYLKYSGDKGKQTSKVYHLKKPYGKYSFIPVDATMIPGPRRPYNFGGRWRNICYSKPYNETTCHVNVTGYLSEEKMKRLESFQSEALESNFTIWYSHYPTSSITSRSPGIRNLVGETGSLYIAGHLHTLGGLSSSLYALNSKGRLCRLAQRNICDEISDSEIAFRICGTGSGRLAVGSNIPHNCHRPRLDVIHRSKIQWVASCSSDKSKVSEINDAKVWTVETHRHVHSYQVNWWFWYQQL